MTTIVSGNCGFSPAPVNHDFTADLSTYWHFAIPREGLDYQWTSMGIPTKPASTCWQKSVAGCSASWASSTIPRTTT